MDDTIATAAEAEENAALPQSVEVHTEGGAPERLELPDQLAKTSVQQKSPAEWAYQRLVLYIQKFEAQLDNEHEVAMGFAGSEAGVLRIEGLGYFDPDIVTFYGADASGARTQLIQHVSQLSVILRAMPKQKDSDAPRRIGFRLASALEKG